MNLTKDQLRSAITSFPYLADFSHSNLYLISKDGLVAYHLGSASENSIQSIGVLLGNLWQTAETLSKFIPQENLNTEPFRLSFGSSSRGIFVLHLMLGGEDYFLSTIFSNTINPAILKNKLRLLKNYLQDSESQFDFKETRQNVETNKYMFQNITNEEIDNLFSSHED